MSMIDDLKKKATGYLEDAEKKKDELVDKTALIKKEYDENQRKKMEDWVYKKEAQLKELEKTLKKREDLIRKKELKLQSKFFVRFIGVAAGLSVIGFFVLASFETTTETGRNSLSTQAQDPEIQSSIPKSPEPYTPRESAMYSTYGDIGELIPRSMQEKAKYYLISVETDGNYIKTLHSRVSTMSHGYSVTRIDCNSQRYQDLGYGEDVQSNIKMYDKVQWTDLVSGSSKYDLVRFACRKAKK